MIDEPNPGLQQDSYASTFAARATRPAAWAALAVGAALLRLLLLDRVPLSESEAAQAFAAWQAAQGQLGSSLAATGTPVLAHALALCFWLFGASDTTARIVSVLGGVALAVSPALLVRPLGTRAAFAAAILIAASPLAIETSRVVDGAVITAALAMLVVGSCIRLFTDYPRWAPWTLAFGLGIAVVHEAAVVPALATAGLAALVAWTPSLQRLGSRAQSFLVAGRAPLAFGAVVAVVAGTGGLMDLGGLGFPLGPLWGGLPTMFRPVPLPARGFVALMAYAGPLLILAIVGSVLAWRRDDRLGLFLGQWTLLLLALAAAFEPAGPVLALLPIAPLSLLAAVVVARLPFGSATSRIGGASLAALVFTILTLAALLIVASQAVGSTRSVGPATLIATAAVVAATAWLWARRVPRAERAPAVVLLAVAIFGAVTLGGIGRLSYGGSPRGTELLAREETDPQFRNAFRELSILAGADSTRALVYDAGTPIAARWYGRSIAQVPVSSSASLRTISFREASAPGNALAVEGERLPWKVVSQIDRGNVDLISVASWALARTRLVDGKPRDIIIIQ